MKIQHGSIPSGQIEKDQLKTGQMNLDQIKLGQMESDQLESGSMESGQIETDIPIGDVQDSLNKALYKNHQKMNELSLQIQELKMQRLVKIKDWVKEKIPNLNAHTLDYLSKQLPEMKEKFDTFREFHKKFGLFENQDYKEALNHLKVLVTARLERYSKDNYVDLLFNSELLSSLENQRDLLFKNQNHMQETLRSLDKASKHGVNTVPSSALPQHPTFKSPALKISAGQASIGQASIGENSIGQASLGQNSISSDSDMDLWMYYFTDIPTSGRTLLWDALDSAMNTSNNNQVDYSGFSGGGGSFNGGGSTGTWDPSSQTPSISDPSSSMLSPNPVDLSSANTQIQVDDLYPDRAIDPDPLPSADDSLSQSIDDESGKYS